MLELPMAYRPDSPPPPSKASLKAWWKQFTTSQRIKKDYFAERQRELGALYPSPFRNVSSEHRLLFWQECLEYLVFHCGIVCRVRAYRYQLRMQMESCTYGVTSPLS